MKSLRLALCLASAACLGVAGVAHSRPVPAQAERPATDTIRLTHVTPAYWRVTFANPPLNIVGPAEVRRLVQILDEIEADPRVKVVVFDSAVPSYFMAHYDLLKPLEDSTGMPPGPTGMHPVPDFMVRLARLKAVTISSIRGRTSGIGSELVLATDMRFTSREKAKLSQFEVGAGGYVNRALPDAELDGFVDALARRIASFDRQAIIDTKHLVDVASLPPDEEMRQGWDAFITSVQRPAAQARVGDLVKRGLQKPGDLEDNLNKRTADYREPRD